MAGADTISLPSLDAICVATKTRLRETGTRAAEPLRQPRFLRIPIFRCLFGQKLSPKRLNNSSHRRRPESSRARQFVVPAIVYSL
jgi:hypothetical protein